MVGEEDVAYGAGVNPGLCQPGLGARATVEKEIEAPPTLKEQPGLAALCVGNDGASPQKSEFSLGRRVLRFGRLRFRHDSHRKQNE